MAIIYGAFIKTCGIFTFLSANDAVWPPRTSFTGIRFRWILFMAMGMNCPRGSGPRSRVSFIRIAPCKVVPEITVPTPCGERAVTAWVHIKQLTWITLTLLPEIHGMKFILLNPQLFLTWSLNLFMHLSDSKLYTHAPQLTARHCKMATMTQRSTQIKKPIH